MAKRLPFDTADAKEFSKVFNHFAYRFSAWEVWCDFVTMFACSISVMVDREDRGRLESRIKMLETILNRYSEEERKSIVALAEITVAALEKNPEQDFLGRLYMSLDFGSKWHGQFFTPWHVAYMMAKMTITDADDDELKRQGYLSCMDPCCGAGCMLIAGAAAFNALGAERNHQEEMLFVGQDLDQIVALMCYIQLSLLGCAGYVAVGNSLTNPVGGTILDPSMKDGGELWFTPMWFSPLWELRRIWHRLQKEAHQQEPADKTN